MKTLCSVIIFLSCLPLLQSQTTQSSPDYRERIGAFLGIPVSSQHGNYTTSCNCPEFQDGKGSGVVIGGYYEHPIAEDIPLLIGVSASYDFRTITSSYIWSEPTILGLVGINNEQQSIAIPFRHRSTFSVGAAYLTPYLKLYPFSRGIFVRVGTQIGSILHHSLTHEKQLTQSTIFWNGNTYDIALRNADNDGFVQLPEGNPETKFTSVNNIQIAGLLTLGADVYTTNNFSFAPMIQYSLPLTQITSSGSNFRVSAFQFLLDIAYRL